MNIAEVINYKLPNSQFVLYGNTYEYKEYEDGSKEGLLWLDSSPVPTLDQLTQWNSELQALRKQDWKSLQVQLTGSEYFQKAYTASTTSLQANSAFTLLLSTIISGHDLNTFIFALSQLRLAMKSLPTIGDFAVDEITNFAQILNNCGFDTSLLAQTTPN